jgi:hypothetical protein
MKCKSGVPTQDGGKSLSIKTSTLSIGKMENVLMFQEERMSKDKKSLHGQDTMVPIRDGKLSTLIRSRLKLKDSTKNLVSISTDLSI